MSDKWFKGEKARHRRKRARGAHRAMRKIDQQITSAIADMIRQQAERKER